MTPPIDGQDWVGLTAERLPVEAALTWTQTPGCGGQVVFTGTVRDHAEGRPGVRWLEYEAYTEQVELRFRALCAEVRTRWAGVDRIVLLHRVGRLAVTEVAVVVAVGAPHRDECFAAARFAIDALKSTAPIWKKETWAGGTAWGAAGGEGAHDVAEVAAPR